MFSFKINKKVSSSSSSSAPVQKSLPIQASKKAFNDDEDRDEEEPDFIDGLDGNEIVSKKKQKKAEKKQLIIPLITKNEWRIDKKKEENEEHRKGGDSVDPKENKEKETVQDSDAAVSKEAQPDEGDLLKQQAIKELLDGANLGHLADRKNDRSIPLLFQNKIPEGYEEEDNMDVSLRPDQASLEDYERIPIEEFGLAMLRGMGWKEDEGIGLRNKKVVDMAEPKLRPKGMGLGAEAAHLNKDVTPKNKSNDDTEKEDLTLKIGGYAIINRGSKKGHYGQIESFDEDNNRVILKLAISGKMEAVSKFYIDVVSTKEYTKSSKVINSEKYEEYKSRQENRNGGDEESNRKGPNEREEMPRRSRSSSSSDEKLNRSRSRRKDRYNDEEDYRSDSRRSGHRHHDKERDERSDRRDDRERLSYDNRYDYREKRKQSKKSDEYYKYKSKSSSRNDEKRKSRRD